MPGHLRRDPRRGRSIWTPARHAAAIASPRSGMKVAADASRLPRSRLYLHRPRFCGRIPAGASDDTIPHSRHDLLCTIVSAARKLASLPSSLRAVVTCVAGARRDPPESETAGPCRHKHGIPAVLDRKRARSDPDGKRRHIHACGSGLRLHQTVGLTAPCENSPSGVRAPKISKTTPCKVAGGRRHPNTQLDTSGKSAAFLHHSAILHMPVVPQ
jgi:hypothetical protein